MVVKKTLALLRDRGAPPARAKRLCGKRSCARSIGLVLALSAPHIASPVAQAAVADICQPEPTCQVHSKQGVQLSMAHEYSAALDEFRAAYAIKPEHRLLINIGRCLYRLN